MSKQRQREMAILQFQFEHRLIPYHKKAQTVRAKEETNPLDWVHVQTSTWRFTQSSNRHASKLTGGDARKVFEAYCQVCRSQ